MKNKEYKCYMCKKVFKKELTDKQAEKQLEEEFLYWITEDCELVCDDCFKKMR